LTPQPPSLTGLCRVRRPNLTQDSCARPPVGNQRVARGVKRYKRRRLAEQLSRQEDLTELPRGGSEGAG
jgi:hypothetical protein